MDNLLLVIRPALALVGAAVALALVIGRRRRHGKPTVNLGLLSPAAVGGSGRGPGPRRERN